MNVGALLDVSELSLNPPLKVDDSVVRNQEKIRELLDALRLDRHWGEFSMDSEFGMPDGWSCIQQGIWENRSALMVQAYFGRGHGTRVKSVIFDPRRAVAHLAGCGDVTFVQSTAKVTINSRTGAKIVAITSGSYANVLTYEAEQSCAASLRAAGYPTKFVLKVPKNPRDRNTNEDLVVEALQRRANRGDILCAALKVGGAYTGISALEFCPGILSTLNHKFEMPDAIKVVYAAFQEAQFIYSETGLVDVDLKTENVFYTFHARKHHRNYVSILLGDLGGFYAEGIKGNPAKKNDRIYGTHVSPAHRVTDNVHSDPYVNNIVETVTMAHLAYSAGIMVLELSKKEAVATLYESVINTIDKKLGDWQRAYDRIVSLHSTPVKKLLDFLVGRHSETVSMGAMNSHFLEYFETVNYAPPAYPVGAELADTTMLEADAQEDIPGNAAEMVDLLLEADVQEGAAHLLLELDSIAMERSLLAKQRDTALIDAVLGQDLEEVTRRCHWASDGARNAALMIAAAAGELPIVDYLLEANAQPSAYLPKMDIGYEGEPMRSSPFLVAVEHGQFDVVGRMLESSPDLLELEDSHGDSALALATSHGLLAMVAYLLEVKGAVVDTHTILYAAARGNMEICQFLNLQGGNFRVDDDYPLLLASAHGHAHVVQWLLENGASARALDNLPLVEACERGHVDVVKLLVEHGAPVDHANLPITLVGEVADLLQLSNGWWRGEGSSSREAAMAPIWDGTFSMKHLVQTGTHGPLPLCQCECGCACLRQSGEEWGTVGPMGSAPYDPDGPPEGQALSLTLNQEGPFHLVCNHCIPSFTHWPHKHMTDQKPRALGEQAARTEAAQRLAVEEAMEAMEEEEEDASHSDYLEELERAAYSESYSGDA